MKKKRILITTSILLIVLTITTLFICYKKDYIFSKEKEKNNFEYMPLTYEICDENSCIYLLGSIHIGDDKVNKFNKNLLDLYKKSDSLAVELDTKNISLDVSKFILTPPTTLDDILSEETKTKINTFIEEQNALPYSQLKNFKIGYLYNYFSLLPMLELGLINSGVDDYFLTLAHKDEKEIIEIETYEEQLSLIIGFSNDFYIAQINELIDNYDEGKKSLEILYETYLTADKETLEILINEDNDREKTEEEKIYEEEMINKRNDKMTNKIEEFLKNDKQTFMIVGLAHVLGENGIINQLQEKNYKIKIIN